MSIVTKRTKYGIGRVVGKIVRQLITKVLENF